MSIESEQTFKVKQIHYLGRKRYYQLKRHHEVVKVYVVAKIQHGVIIKKTKVKYRNYEYDLVFVRLGVKSELVIAFLAKNKDTVLIYTDFRPGK
ncbi:MAG: hypothetical protein V1928_04015 [Parcubacteria group bacterium]